MREGELKRSLTFVKNLYVNDFLCSCPFCQNTFMQPVPIDELTVQQQIKEALEHFSVFLSEAKGVFPHLIPQIPMGMERVNEYIHKELEPWFRKYFGDLE